jgi:hypothetical protein
MYSFLARREIHEGGEQRGEARRKGREVLGSTDAEWPPSQPQVHPGCLHSLPAGTWLKGEMGKAPLNLGKQALG